MCAFVIRIRRLRGARCWHEKCDAVIVTGAGRLRISRITSGCTKNHVQRILRKLHVTNRAQALGKALALGMMINP